MSKHSRNKSRNSNIRIKPGMLVFLTIITTIIIALFSVSRYQSTMAGDDTGKVAKIILNKSQDIGISLDGDDFYPGSTYIYEFGITNEDNGNVLETKMNYTITVNDLGYIPLTYELETVSVTGSGTGITDVSSKKSLTKGVATNKGIMPLTPDTHTYKLYIHWDEANNNASYSKLLENIEISIDAIQIN